MINPIKQIYDFNLKAGLLGKDYNDLLEDSMCIEECLEGYQHLDRLSFDIEEYTPKLVSRAIVSTIHSAEHISDVERLDKACDKVIIAIGSMAKLGLNPNQITRALNTVMNANLAKLDMPKDEHGKLTKPDNFVGPEAKLQEILNERI